MILNKIGLRFMDIDSAANFFIKKLNFIQHSLMKTVSGKRIICIQKNGIVLELFETKNKLNSRGFLKLLSFEVTDIAKTINELENKGVVIAEREKEGSNLAGKKFYYAYFYGPESILLGLFQESKKSHG